MTTCNKKLTADEKLRTVVCCLIFAMLFCVVVLVLAHMEKEDPVARTPRPVNYSTRWDR